MTGPYTDAPLGLSNRSPRQAGPFNPATVVVRAKVEVDPHTAQLTITTDPPPQIIKTAPNALHPMNTTIDRPDFTFNPTNHNQ